MGKYLKLSPPKRGSKITVAKNGQLQVPDDPIVPFILGEGLSSALWKPAHEVFDIAVDRCYANAKRLEWLEVFAGDRGSEVYGSNSRLPEDTIRAVQEYKVCIKGPLAPRAGAGVELDELFRQQLDLFAHVKPIRYLDGVASPLKFPHGLEVLVFREHTEDVTADVEWKKGSPESKQLLTLLNEDLAKKLGKSVRPDSSLNVKAVSATATKRLIRLAVEYAIKHKRRSVTFAHNEPFMHHTEGFFRDWGYELTRKEFTEYTVTEHEVESEHGGVAPRGRLVIKDRATQQLIQELLRVPEDHDVIAATSLNGLYLQAMSEAAVGAAGLAPDAYIGSKAAIFEATHTLNAPELERPEEANPTSVLLCGVMLFDHLGWKDSAELITHSLIKTISDGKVTKDLARNRPEAEIVDGATFCETVVENFEEVRKSRVRLAMKRTASNML